MRRAYLGVVAVLPLICSLRGSPETPPKPDFVFTVQLEKNVFKPGEPLTALALLKNQSDVEIYVPPMMTMCMGSQSHVEFSITPEPRVLSGRGSGVGFSLSSSHNEKVVVRSTWIPLKRGHIFGAKVDSLHDAPSVPGTYKLVGIYTVEKASGIDAALDHVIQGQYKSQPVTFHVRR